ncbi:cytochrome P450 [Staphylococcus aureus]
MIDLKESLFDGLEDIIRAGTESTSLIIQWSIVYVVKYQHVQLNMQAEIDSLLKEKNKLKPDLDDRSERKSFTVRRFQFSRHRLES